MKIGTLLCNIFGHVFVYESYVDDANHCRHHTPIRTDFCIRCGIDKCSGQR